MPRHPVLTPIRQRLKKPHAVASHGVSSDTFSDRALSEASADTVVTMKGSCVLVPVVVGALAYQLLRGYRLHTRC